MNCQTVRERLGSYVDGELRPDVRVSVEAHLDECAACRAEVEAIRGLEARLATPVDEELPAGLWASVARRLDQAGWASRGRQPVVPTGRLALAASVALLIGASIFATVLVGPGPMPGPAPAIDFAMLLDHLGDDSAEAVDAFLARYGAEPISPSQAASVAPQLHVTVPDKLPGGFRLQQAYRLQFEDEPGVALRYARGDDVLVKVTYPPQGGVDFGDHVGSSCMIGRTPASQIEVGPWRLVNLREGTSCRCLAAGRTCRCGHGTMTCHSVLSQLDLERELPAVLAALVPGAGS